MALPADTVETADHRGAPGHLAEADGGHQPRASTLDAELLRRQSDLETRLGAAARAAIADDIRGNADVYSSFLPVDGDAVPMPQLLQPIVVAAAAPKVPRAARASKPRAVARQPRVSTV